MILADVMTEKATIEIPSPVHGKVLALGGAAGQVMAVGADLIQIEVEGAGNQRPSGPVVVTATMPAPATVAAAPAAVPVPSKVPAPTVAPVKATARAAGDKPIASPAVRRRAWDMGIELQFVPGSGPAGRIVHEDLDAYAARGAAGGERGSRYAERNDEQAIALIGMRRKIAQKMQESKRRIPHFSYVEEIDVTELEALRARLNEQWGKERGRLTVLPLLMRAVVLALRQFPQMNARFDDDAGVVTQYGAVHMGVATQTDAGLMVTVMRHAEARDIWASAAEVARLAAAAREGKAAREELSGSTITISSLGALGGIVTTPVINHPEVAIIGVNKIVDRPMIRNGAMVARKMMNLSSSFDHRVVDGMHAAEFIQAIRALLECPAVLFVE
jgi:2-oxoisovalerate dehydrogenase E2 component (dihydrolipoyl transacylase)